MKRFQTEYPAMLLGLAYAFAAILGDASKSDYRFTLACIFICTSCIIREMHEAKP